MHGIVALTMVTLLPLMDLPDFFQIVTYSGVAATHNLLPGLHHTGVITHSSLSHVRVSTECTNVLYLLPLHRSGSLSICTSVCLSQCSKPSGAGNEDNDDC